MTIFLRPTQCGSSLSVTRDVELELELQMNTTQPSETFQSKEDIIMTTRLQILIAGTLFLVSIAHRQRRILRPVNSWLQVLSAPPQGH